MTHARTARIVSLAAVSLLSCVAPATSQSNEPNFAGEYVMKGKGFGANDSAYAGTCSLKEEAKIYQVSCFNEDTRHTYTGKGLALGETLAVFIGDVLRGDHNMLFAGEYLIIYRRQPDGRLVGTWAHAESQASGAETLTPR